MMLGKITQTSDPSLKIPSYIKLVEMFPKLFPWKFYQAYLILQLGNEILGYEHKKLINEFKCQKIFQGDY